MNTVYVLMLLSPTMGWIMAPVDGNPSPTAKACAIVESLIIKRNMHWIDGHYIERPQCEPRKVK